MATKHPSRNEDPNVALGFRKPQVHENGKIRSLTIGEPPEAAEEGGSKFCIEGAVRLRPRE